MPSISWLTTTHCAKKLKAGRTGTFSSCRFRYLSQHSDSPTPALMAREGTPHPAAPMRTWPGNGQLLLPPEGQEPAHCGIKAGTEPPVQILVFSIYCSPSERS